MTTQTLFQRSTKRITSLSQNCLLNKLYRPIHSEYLYLQKANLISNASNFNQQRSDNTYKTPLQTISIHPFTTSTSEQKQKRKRPLLNRFLRIFAIGPKIHFILEKSGNFYIFIQDL